ncbi:DDE-type integrase/transposase/recombinase [Bacillus thuringiensis]|nr:DDE-type integrase/transposase/recombinase [Bacillus thuringiensis]MED3183854.1 DDE-type integrase/transposase/recombinase [Bacillus thuringiensis]
MSKNRKTQSAKRFFKKSLTSCHVTKPRVLTADKNPTYPKAMKQSKKEKYLPVEVELRQKKHLNNMVI